MLTFIIRWWFLTTWYWIRWVNVQSDAGWKHDLIWSKIWFVFISCLIVLLVLWWSSDVSCYLKAQNKIIGWIGILSFEWKSEGEVRGQGDLSCSPNVPFFSGDISYDESENDKRGFAYPNRYILAFYFRAKIHMRKINKWPCLLCERY